MAPIERLVLKRPLIDDNPIQHGNVNRPYFKHYFDFSI